MSDERENRNSVFNATGPGPVVTQVPQISAAEKVKQDFGLELAIETAPLPSGGKIYQGVLAGRDSVDIKAMTTREEDILMSKPLIKNGTVLNELVKACLIDKTINPNELIVGDKYAILVAIRVTGYGAEYQVQMECSSCKEKFEHEFDLAALQIKPLQIDPVIPGTNLFEFKLPVCKKIVRFKYLTGADEADITATLERQKKLKIQVDSPISTNLLYSIVSVDGIEDRAKLGQFVRMMPARDSLALRKYIQNNEPSLDMKQYCTCPHCSNEEEVGIPMGINFFWPNMGA